eukprot:4400862-Pleurochrysis_carterae.AAC.4
MTSHAGMAGQSSRTHLRVAVLQTCSLPCSRPGFVFSLSFLCASCLLILPTLPALHELSSPDSALASDLAAVGMQIAI